MVHYGTGRLSLKGSCSIRAPEVGGAGGAWRDGVSLCCETLPQAAGSLSASETLHHPACSGARDACSAVTPHSHSSNTLFHPHRKDKDFVLLLLSVEGSNIVRLRRVVQSRKTLKTMNWLVGYMKQNIKLVASVTCTSYSIFFLSFSVFFICLFTVMCVCFVLVLRRTSFPVQPVRCLFHPEGQPAASHQAPFRGETLQMSPMQLRLSQEGRPHRPFTHPLGWVCTAHSHWKPCCVHGNSRTAGWKPLQKPWHVLQHI